MKVHLGVDHETVGFVDVKSLGEAAHAVIDFIAEHDLNRVGHRSFTGGELLDEGEVIAYVSFYGTVRDLDNNEVRLQHGGRGRWGGQTAIRTMLRVA